jgi:MFS family permease
MTRLPAVGVFLALEGLASFASMLTFTVTNVYYVREIGMSPLLLVLCGTAMELAIVVFEIPTGVVADTFGRRASVILSFAVTGVATVLFGVLTAPWAIVAAYGLWGVGYTFQSGALQAWIVDEVGEERMGRVLLRGGQVGWASALLGVGASAAVGSVDLRAAIVAGGVGFLLLAAFLAIAMPETGFRPAPRGAGVRGGVAASLRTAGHGARLVRGTPILVLMVAIALPFGLWTESFDRLWQAHVLTSVGIAGTAGLGEVGWVALLTAVAFGLGVLTNEVGIRRLEGLSRARTARALLGLHAALLAAALAFALATTLALGVAAYVLVAGLRSLVVPLGQIWANREVQDASARATVLSIVNQADALGQVAGGPAIGAIGSAVSLRAALTVGACALAPAVALLARASRVAAR